MNGVTSSSICLPQFSSASTHKNDVPIDKSENLNCEWTYFNHGAKNVTFAFEGETTNMNGVTSSSICLPQFSSASTHKSDVPIDKSENLNCKEDFVLHAGGSVWALDWCPQVHQASDCYANCEYLAVAAHPPGSSYHQIGLPLMGRGLIQIWCILNVNKGGSSSYVYSSEQRKREGPRKQSYKEQSAQSNSRMNGRGRPQKTMVVTETENSDSPMLSLTFEESSFKPGTDDLLENGKLVGLGVKNFADHSVLSDGRKRSRGRPRKAVITNEVENRDSSMQSLICKESAVRPGTDVLLENGSFSSPRSKESVDPAKRSKKRQKFNSHISETFTNADVLGVNSSIAEINSEQIPSLLNCSKGSPIRAPLAANSLGSTESLTPDSLRSTECLAPAFSNRMEISLFSPTTFQHEMKGKSSDPDEYYRTGDEVSSTRKSKGLGLLDFEASTEMPLLQWKEVDQRTRKDLPVMESVGSLSAMTSIFGANSFNSLGEDVALGGDISASIEKTIDYATPILEEDSMPLRKLSNDLNVDTKIPQSYNRRQRKQLLETRPFDIPPNNTPSIALSNRQSASNFQVGNGLFPSPIKNLSDGVIPGLICEAMEGPVPCRVKNKHASQVQKCSNKSRSFSSQKKECPKNSGNKVKDISSGSRCQTEVQNSERLHPVCVKLCETLPVQEQIKCKRSSQRKTAKVISSNNECQLEVQNFEHLHPVCIEFCGMPIRDKPNGDITSSKVSIEVLHKDNVILEREHLESRIEGREITVGSSKRDPKRRLKTSAEGVAKNNMQPKQKSPETSKEIQSHNLISNSADLHVSRDLGEHEAPLKIDKSCSILHNSNDLLGVVGSSKCGPKRRSKTSAKGVAINNVQTKTKPSDLSEEVSFSNPISHCADLHASKDLEGHKKPLKIGKSDSILLLPLKIDKSNSIVHKDNALPVLVGSTKCGPKRRLKKSVRGDANKDIQIKPKSPDVNEEILSCNPLRHCANFHSSEDPEGRDVPLKIDRSGSILHKDKTSAFAKNNIQTKPKSADVSKEILSSNPISHCPDLNASNDLGAHEVPLKIDKTGSILHKDDALPKVVLCLLHMGRLAWDVKWRPLHKGILQCDCRMGYLAALLGNGSLEVWEVPLPHMVKTPCTSSKKEGMDPHFLRLKPVFRCSKLKAGEKQSIPIVLEWSPSSPSDLLLAGCHDGMVALWKFSAKDSSPDTKPLLCFSADSVPIRSISWAPDGSDTESSNLIVTAAGDGLKFWDLRDPYLPLWSYTHLQRHILSVDWLSNPRWIVLSYDDGFLRILNLDKAASNVPVTGKPSCSSKTGIHSIPCSAFAIWSVQVSRATGLVAYCGVDGCASYFRLPMKGLGRYPVTHIPCGSMLEEDHNIVIKIPVQNRPLNHSSAKVPMNTKKSADAFKPIRIIKDFDGSSISKDPKGKAAGGKNNSKEEKKLTCFAGDEDAKQAVTREAFPVRSIAMHRVRWNMNRGSERWLCYGGAAGIIHVQEIS